MEMLFRGQIIQPIYGKRNEKKWFTNIVRIVCTFFFTFTSFDSERIK